jgi:spermidine/putrescine-binding protein
VNVQLQNHSKPLLIKQRGGEKMEKKKFLMSISVMLFIVLANGAFAAKPYEGQTLSVSTWSGPFAKNYTEAIVKPFEEWSGAKVTVVPGWAELVTKIIAAPPDQPPYDVLLGEGRIYTQARINNLILPINFDNIPNHKDIWPSLKKYPGYRDKYGVPYQGAVVGLNYLPKKVPFTPTAWKDFTKPEVKGKVCLDRAWWLENFYLAAYLMGQTNITGKWIVDNLDKLFEVVKTQLAPNVKVWYKGGADLFAYMKQGEVWLAPYYVGSSYQMKLGGLDLNFIFPKEGFNGYYDYQMIVRGTKKKELGEAFINFALKPEAQAEFVKRQFNSVANKYTNIPQDVKWFIMNTSGEYERFSVFDWEPIEPLYKQIDERWNKEILPIAGK